MGSSATTNQQNSNASNTASNQNSASNYGQNTASTSGQNTANVSGQNTVANTAYANGPSAAGQALIGAATSPQNTIANTQAYMNPYTQNVLGSQQAIQQQQLGQALSGVAGNAISQGALGGSRMGVAQALTAGQLQQANNAANASTLQQGYSQALQAAQNTGAQQLQGAGLSGTQGSTSSDTGTLGQQLSSMLGQQQSSTAGQTQSAASGTQSQAGVSDGSGTTTQNPGALGYLGLGLGLLRGSAQANGGAVKGYDNGGAVTGSVPVTTADGRTVYVPYSAISGSQQGAGGLSSLGGQSTQDAMHLYKLGSQARNTLSNFLTGASGQQASTAQQPPAQAPIAAIGQGLSSLGNAASSGLSSLGSAMGFASGGSPAAKAATVSMPSLGSFLTPAAASPVAGLSSGAFYTPAVAVQATPTMPSLSSPSVSMPSFSMPSVAAPNVAAPTVEQALMPYVATPNHSPVSSGGKGSGGAVRGLANGGLARLLKEFEGEGKVPGREDGGELDTGHSDPDLSGFMDYLANQQDDHNAENAPGPEPKQSALEEIWYDPKDQPAAHAATPSKQPAQSDSAAAPVTLGNGFAMVPGQAVSPSAPAAGGLAPLASLAPSVAAAPPAALPDAPTVVKSETYRPDGTQVSGEKVPNPFAGATPIPASTPKPLVGRQAVAGTIRDELASAGMSEAGIQGIMANVKDESNFDPTSRHPDQPRFGGEAHYAHGLYQQGGAEWNNYAKWLEENHTGANWRDPKLQTQFLAQNLKENYPAVWEKMNTGSPEQAAQAFVSGYLKPREDLRLAREGQYGRGVASVADFINGAVGKIKSGVGSLVNGDAGERKDIVPASNPADARSQPWTMDNFASNLGNSLRGSPLGKAAYGDLSGLTRMAPVVSALAGGPGGLGASRAMEAQQEQDIKRAQMQRQSQQEALKRQMDYMEHAWKLQQSGEDNYGNKTFTPVIPREVDAMMRQKLGLPEAQQQPAASPGKSPSIDPALMGEEAREALEQANPIMARKVQRMLDGQEQIPVGRGRTPKDNEAWDYATRISNGRVTPGNYQTIVAANKKMASGPWADTQVAANKAVNHTFDLISKVPELNNTSMEWLNKSTGNLAEGMPASDTPGVPLMSSSNKAKYQSALAGARTNKLGVSGELAKVFKGAGATSEKEINDWKENFSEYSPDAKLISAGQEAMKMMMGQLDPLASKINEERHKLPGDRGYITGRDLMAKETQKKYDMIMSIDPGQGADGMKKVLAGASSPSVPKPAGLSDDEIKARAQASIASGKDAAAVNAQLQAWGIR